MSMSRKEYQLLLKIGANLSNDFNTSFTGACGRLKELAKETKETSNTLKNVSGYQKTQTALEATEKKLVKQQEEYKRLREEIENVSQNAVDKFNNKLEKQKSRVEATGREFSQQITVLQSLKRAENILGSSTELTDKLEKQQKRVEALAEKLGKQKKRYEELKESQENAKNPAARLTEELHRQEERIKETESAIEEQRQTLDDYSDSLKEAGVDVSNLTEEQERLREEEEKLNNAQKTIRKIGEEHDRAKEKVKEQAVEVGKLVGVYAAAGAAVYKGAIEPAIEFESAYTGVLKTVDGTPEQLQQIKDEILELSTVTPNAATEIAAVAESAGQLGIATENITDFSAVMIDLGESTNLSATQAASDLAKFANITKMEADKYSNLGSVIVDLGNNFATTESDIVEMATRLAATGEMVGLSEAQIMAIATALSSVGIEAEAGGSAVSKLLKKMDVAAQTYATAKLTVDATGYSTRELEMMSSLDGKAFKEVAKNAGLTTAELKEYMSSVASLEQFSDTAGMSAEKFIKAWKDDSVSALSMFINGLNDTERTGKSAVELLNDMGLTEVRLSNAVLSLASSDDILTKTVQTANTAWEENTALTEEAGKRYKTTESQLQMAKNSLNNAGVALGEAFTPYVAEAAQGINEFAQNAAKWIRDNPETIKQITSLATSIGGTLLVFKGFKLAGSGIQTAVTGVKNLAAQGKLLSSVGWGLIGIGIAAVGAAFVIANRRYKEFLQSTTDALLYNNEAATSLSDLTESVTSYGTEAYKAAQRTNEQIAELEEIRGSLAEAKTEAEYYGSTLRENCVLSPQEAASLKQPFDDLANYLEQDFSASFNTVFENFQTSAIGVMKELGGDIAEVDSLLQTFKNKYSENVDTANQDIQNYLDKSIAGTATEDDRQQFENSQAMLYALAEADSQSKKDFDAAVADLGGIDFGENQEAAIAKIQEMTEYANSYLEEINNAQKAIQEENENLQRRNEVQHDYGFLTDEEYENGKNALAVASVASNTAYRQSYDGFLEQYKEVLNQIQGELDVDIQKALSKSMNSGNWVADIGGSFAAWGNMIGSGFSKSWDEAWRENHLNDVKSTMSELIGAVDDMATAAEVTPITIPIETVQTANTSGLISQWNDTGNSKKHNRAIPATLGDIIKVSAAYAGGTNYSADTFLAGENGAEIITNAKGYKVYTAEETKDIFDTYAQITSYIPRFASIRNNNDKGGGYSGIEAARGEMLSYAPQGEKDVKCEINYNPTILVDGGNAEELEEKLKQNNENLLKLFKDYMREEAENERRMNYA